MADQDRIYFAQRAAEEQQLAEKAAKPDVAEAHRKLQRVEQGRLARPIASDQRETIG